VQAEGGRLQIRSRVGMGTAARVCWPAAVDHVDTGPEYTAFFIRPTRMRQELSTLESGA